MSYKIKFQLFSQACVPLFHFWRVCGAAIGLLTIALFLSFLLCMFASSLNHLYLFSIHPFFASSNTLRLQLLPSLYANRILPELEVAFMLSYNALNGKTTLLLLMYVKLLKGRDCARFIFIFLTHTLT